MEISKSIILILLIINAACAALNLMSNNIGAFGFSCFIVGWIAAYLIFDKED